MKEIYTKYIIEFYESENLGSVSLWGDLVKIEPVRAKDNKLLMIHIYDFKEHLIGTISCYKATLIEKKYYYDERGNIVFLKEEA